MLQKGLTNKENLLDINCEKERQIETFLELLVDENFKTTELIAKLAENEPETNKVLQYKERIQDLSEYALLNKLVEKNGERLSVSKLGERFLFSSKTYIR